MKSLAYIITRQNVSELLEENIIEPILTGEAGVRTTALYFVGDGVYYLIKGNRNAKNIKSIIKKGLTKFFVCETSVKNRKLQNVLIDGIVLGTMKDFLDVAASSDHIISL